MQKNKRVLYFFLNIIFPKWYFLVDFWEMRSEAHTSSCHPESHPRDSDVIEFPSGFATPPPAPGPSPSSLLFLPLKADSFQLASGLASRRKAQLGNQRRGREKLGCFFQRSLCLSLGGVKQWPCKISGAASRFQDCSFLPSTPPAFLGSTSPPCTTLPSPCIFRLRIGGLPLSGFSPSSADSPDPANTSVGCPFIKIPPFKLSLILFPSGISVIGWLYHYYILLHLQNQQIWYILSSRGTVICLVTSWVILKVSTN